MQTKNWSQEINIDEWGQKLREEGIESIWTTMAEASQTCNNS